MSAEFPYGQRLAVNASPPQSFGSRSNAYSGSKFTNWAVYDPFFLEAKSALKRFGQRLPAEPTTPRVLVIPPLEDFIHPCRPAEVKARLLLMPEELIEGLRAVFLLGGTRKQQQCWRSNLACYGIYMHMQSCIFLCAHPYQLGTFNLDTLRDFYLDEVLVHEVGHHVDRRRRAARGDKEAFAHAFVERHGDRIR